MKKDYGYAALNVSAETHAIIKAYAKSKGLKITSVSEKICWLGLDALTKPKSGTHNANKGIGNNKIK